MTIKIPVKKKSFSDKAETGSKTTSPDKHDEGDNPQEAVPVPFIDKISIVVHPASEADATAINAAVWTTIGDEDLFISSAGKGKTGEFKLVKLIALQGLPKARYPLFQYAYSEKAAKKLRLEFVPVDLADGGLDELRAIMMSILPDGWSYVTKHGRVTRVDVSVDVPGVRMDAFQAVMDKKTARQQWSRQGRLRTVVLGSGKSNSIKIYDRKAKRLAKGQEFAGATQVRIECVLRNPALANVAALSTLANPFANVSMVLNMPGPPADEAHSRYWEAFVDSVRVRGVDPALALLSKARRTKYRAYLKAHPQPWWKPDAIWAHWQSALKASKLVD